MRKGIKGLFGVLIVVSIILSGCIVTPPVDLGQWVLKDYWQHYILSEHYYTYSYLLYPGYNCDNVKIVVSCSKAPSYGFEVWIMTQTQFNNFVNSNVVSVVDHFTVYTGNYTFYSSAMSPGGTYRIVIDNTDYGWVDTNWDGYDDYCRFDADIYFHIN